MEEFQDKQNQEFVIKIDDNPSQQQQQKSQLSKQLQKYQEIIYQKIGISNATHPLYCFLHIIFKASALFTYLFIGLIFSSIIQFILVFLINIIDFWIVKNITGRFLVGMKWEISLDEKGKQIYTNHFNKEHQVNKIDRIVFWAAQIIFTLFWLLLSLLKFFGFDFFWLTLCVCSFILSFSNFYGYYKCREELKGGFGQIISKGVQIGKIINNLTQK